MSNIIEKIDINKTCSFTGHRNLYNDFDRNKLKEIIKEVIKDGFNTFLVGMAVGYDTVCFQILEELREENDIKIIACIPCENQSLKFSVKQKEEYERMVNSADEKIILSKTYTRFCMLKRNEFMVNNSSVVVAYLRENKGGTFYTVNYAKRKNKKIVML